MAWEELLTGNARSHSLQRKELKGFSAGMVSLPYRLGRISCSGQNSRSGPDTNERGLKPSSPGITSHTW